MGNQSNIEALKAMGYKEPECNVADLYDTPENHKTKAKILPIFSVVARLLKKRCPKCRSKNTKIVCYSGNSYADMHYRQTGRDCKDCNHFWFS